MNLMEFILGYRDGSEAGIQLATARRVLEQLLHSSSQGRGIGTLLSYLELGEATVKPHSDGCSVDQNVFASILDNAKASRDWLTNMERALSALTSEVTLRRLSGGELAEKVTGILDEYIETSRIRKHILAVEIGRSHGEIYADADVLADVLRELVLNALKYSPAGSLVKISTGFNAGYFEVQVENLCEGRSKSGKKPDKSLMRPFFKLDNQIDDRYAAFGYGIGIGLTIAEYQVRQLRGTLEIFNKKVLENPGLAVRVAFPATFSHGDSDAE